MAAAVCSLQWDEHVLIHDKQCRDAQLESAGCAYVASSRPVGTVNANEEQLLCTISCTLIKSLQEIAAAGPYPLHS